MVWQDYVITSGNIIFALNLLPQLKNVIKDNHYLNLWTCSLTFLTLCVMNITMATLGLWLSALPICTIVWGLLLIFSYRNKRD